MKKFVFMLGLILSLTIVAAAYDVEYKERLVETKYFPRESVVISRTILANYDNDDRYSTYVYRHGYSYRNSLEYFEDKHDVILFSGYNNYDRDYNYKRDYYYDYDRDYNYDRDYDYNYDRYYDNSYDYDYRRYNDRECYTTPPANKLFYIKC